MFVYYRSYPAVLPTVNYVNFSLINIDFIKDVSGPVVSKNPFVEFVFFFQLIFTGVRPSFGVEGYVEYPFFFIKGMLRLLLDPIPPTSLVEHWAILGHKKNHKNSKEKMQYHFEEEKSFVYVTLPFRLGGSTWLDGFPN